MAGLSYNCRCFTVTGNVAPMPNPSGGSGGSSGSGGAHSPPAIDCNGNAIQLATPATVLQHKPNRSFIYASSYAQTWIAPQKCQVLIHATAAGGGGGGCVGFRGGDLYSSDCIITNKGAYSGSPGGNGGPGASVLNQWFALNAGDAITMNVGIGGSLGQLGGWFSTTPTINIPATAGGNTIITVANQGTIFLPGGHAGKQGTYPKITYGTACGRNDLIIEASGAYQTVLNWPCVYVSGAVPYGLEWSNDSELLGNDFCTVTGRLYYGPNGLTPEQSGCKVTAQYPTYSSSYGAGMFGTVFFLIACPNGGVDNPRAGDGLVVIDYIPCPP